MPLIGPRRSLLYAPRGEGPNLLAVTGSTISTFGVDPTIAAFTYGAGDLVVAAVIANAGGATVSVSSAGLGTLAAVPGTPIAPLTNNIGFLYAFAVGGATEDIESDLGGTSGTVAVIAISGAKIGGGTTTFETSTSSADVGSVPGSITTTGANRLLLSALRDFSSAVDTGWTAMGSATAVGHAQYRIVSTQGTFGSLNFGGGSSGTQPIAVGAVKSA